jgi:large subunit ribosomal protein L21
MYAIVKTGGKQYRVERGQRLLVERLAAEQGADVALEPILYRSDEAVFDKPGLETVTVTAKVIDHVRGEKLRVFKFKPKRGYKRRNGHRQELTRIEVTDISQGARRQAAKAAEPVAEAQPKTTKAPAKASAGAAKPAAEAPPKAAAKAPGRAPAKASTGKPAGKAGAKAGEKAAAKPARKASAKPAAKAPAKKEKPEDGS